MQRKNRLEIELLKVQETVKKRELKIEAFREDELKAQRKRRQEAQDRWLQTEYSSQLYHQCKTYFNRLDRLSKENFLGNIKDKINQGLFNRYVVLTSLWTPNKAYTSTWSQVKDLVVKRFTKHVRCSKLFSELISLENS